MISIANIVDFESPVNSKYTHFDEGLDSAPYLLSGAQEYDTLCPVSKLTGHRSSPLSLLQLALGEKRSRLLDAILQDLPTVAAMDVSDEDKLSLLVSRHHSGTLAEQDIIVKELSQVTDVIFPSSPEVADEVKQQIKFDTKDSPEEPNQD